MHHITINHVAAELEAQHRSRQAHRQAENRRLARAARTSRQRPALHLGQCMVRLWKHLSSDMDVNVNRSTSVESESAETLS